MCAISARRTSAWPWNSARGSVSTCRWPNWRSTASVPGSAYHVKGRTMSEASRSDSMGGGGRVTGGRDNGSVDELRQRGLAKMAEVYGTEFQNYPGDHFAMTA